MSLEASDKPAAFRGLIITALLLLGMVLAIVKLTNAKFAGHEAGAAATAEH